MLTYKEIIQYTLPLAIIQRLGVDERGRPLTLDGVLGPKTMGATFLDPRGKYPPVVMAALGELLDGAQEQHGNNSGPYVAKYNLDRDPLESESYGAWCAAFAGWCLRYTDPRAPYSRGARRLVSRLESVFLKDVAPGDLISWERQSAGNAWSGHVGIIAEVTCDHIYTIEGNVGRTGAVRVFRYDRRDPDRGHDQWLRIGRWNGATK